MKPLRKERLKGGCWDEIIAQRDTKKWERRWNCCSKRYKKVGAEMKPLRKEILNSRRWDETFAQRDTKKWVQRWNYYGERYCTTKWELKWNLFGERYYKAGTETKPLQRDTKCGCWDETFAKRDKWELNWNLCGERYYKVGAEMKPLRREISGSWNETFALRREILQRGYTDTKCGCWDETVAQRDTKMCELK